MNTDQIWGIMRTLIAAVVAYAAAKEWIPLGFIPEELIAAIATVIVTLWSVFTKTTKATVEKAAAMVPISAASQREAGIDKPLTPAGGAKVH